MKLTQTITIAFLTVPSVCFAWISNTAPNVHHRSRVLFMSDEQLSDLPGTGLIESDNPCWEDIYDTDCAMENIFAARFKASEWIKSMPCAEGIEDCDMPEELKLPGTHQDAGIDHVNVKEFLHLKRAAPVSKSSSKSDDPLP
mmetsp:Transcript_434/g.1220  ORF Transcript_434/g.1220 Transcript_434/m.1220 type:complete len:142 (-) Transcript_434:72-497(-)